VAYAATPILLAKTLETEIQFYGSSLAPHPHGQAQEQLSLCGASRTLAFINHLITNSGGGISYGIDF
jgi:hypothetical protein